MKVPGLNMVGCCNELNAGYAADGYARAAGIGCVVVTHLVGGLSVLNAVAGCDHVTTLCRPHTTQSAPLVPPEAHRCRC